MTRHEEDEMSHTTSSGHATYTPSRGAEWARTLAIAAVAGLAATVTTLAVVDDEPAAGLLPAVDAPAVPDPGAASVHDSAIDRLVRERAAGGSATQHDSGIERILRDRGAAG